MCCAVLCCDVLVTRAEQIFDILKGVNAPGVQIHTGQAGTSLVPDKVALLHDSVAEEQVTRAILVLYSCCDRAVIVLYSC